MLITIAILLLINFGVAWIFEMKFFDIAVFVGIFVAVVIRFFNSSGGYTSRSMDLQIQSSTGIKQDTTSERKFSPSISFYTAVGYSVVALIGTLIYYREYFL
ncbi:hypothetical protein [Radiobacillus sp. PE A8.2]|uniref:hypothetical protein n=1 Tax=Radiobacillus sp. PE A8.2 TaxID=3380349 RepID=UPI0038903155